MRLPFSRYRGFLCICCLSLVLLIYQFGSPDLQVENIIANGTRLPACNDTPPNLIGKLDILKESLELEELEKSIPNLELGGRHRPLACASRHSVAIIVPFRDRHTHLKIFLRNLHPLLQRQQLDYGIYVIEQAGNNTFNRGLIKNIGFAIAAGECCYTCFIFHDVDLIPEDDRNPYNCNDSPRHLSRSIDIFKYKLPRALKNLFGGVISLKKEDFAKANGYSNEYWGWGGEDNELYNRLKFIGLGIDRYAAEISRYQMLHHEKDQPNPQRYNILKKAKSRWKTDGLNSIDKHYKLLKFVKYKLYTHAVVQVFP